MSDPTCAYEKDYPVFLESRVNPEVTYIWKTGKRNKNDARRIMLFLHISRKEVGELTMPWEYCYSLCRIMQTLNLNYLIKF